MPEFKYPIGLGSHKASTPEKPKVRSKDDQYKPKEEKESDPNSVVNVLRRGFMPMAERAEAEMALKRRQK